jgi:transcriptional regulator with PAS, ATPase and Fis domain
VSRRHAELAVVPEGIRIKDLGSTNGTWWQGTKVGEVVVPSGATVQFGATPVRIAAAEALSLPPSEQDRFGAMAGKSVAMRELFAVLEMAAPTDATVLIEGESGTGKELAARAIHEASPRAKGPCIVVDCSAIAENLFDSHLFGHVRGAFTGAVANRQGRLEQAHKGTLFLDEVGTMSPALQAKLLRVLQEREFERVGDGHTIKVDVRIVAATHSDLQKMVGDGSFREDLFYRLNVIPVRLPALRERREDVPLLVQHFLQKLGAEHTPPRSVTMSQEAVRLLMSYDWPGNVRQLENVVERAMAFSQGRSQIEVSDLGPDIQKLTAAVNARDGWFPDEGIDLERYMEGLELSLIRRSLERTQGNKVQAARLLNLKRTTLIEKLKRLERAVTNN